MEGGIERRQGHWEKSTRDFDRVLELDPRNITILAQTALSHRWFRRYAEEKSLFDRVLTVQPNDAVLKAELASVELDQKADIRPLRSIIDSVLATDPAQAPTIADFRLICALAERDAAGAKDALMALGENAVRLVRANSVIFLVHL